MTTDKELLELAAKAAGYVVKPAGWTDSFMCRMIDKYTEEGEQCHSIWNPLTDDGDALRLAVDLSLEVGIWDQDYMHGDPVVIVCDNTTTEERFTRESIISNPHAATRRAIVRAAAEIGKAMP